MVEQRVAVRPSVILAVALGIAHLAAAVPLWLAPVAGPVKAACAFAIAASLIWFMARDALLHAPQSIVAMEIRDGPAVRVQTRSGTWLDVELIGSSYVSPWLTIIGFRPAGRWRARRVVLVPDNVDPEDFRRLRTSLRWKKGGTEPKAESLKI